MDVGQGMLPLCDHAGAAYRHQTDTDLRVEAEQCGDIALWGCCCQCFAHFGAEKQILGLFQVHICPRPTGGCTPVWVALSPPSAATLGSFSLSKKHP